MPRYVDINDVESELMINSPLLYEEIQEYLSNVPTATVQPTVRAKWNETPTQFKCSVCGTTQLLKSNYCPHCGADMRGDKR